MGFTKGWYGPSYGSRCGLDGPSEFGFGPGPVPPGAEYATPEDGGAYVARSPDMTEPRRKHRASGAPAGNPGDLVAR